MMLPTMRSRRVTFIAQFQVVVKCCWFSLHSNGRPYIPNLKKIGKKLWSLSWTEHLCWHTDRHTHTHTDVHSSHFAFVQCHEWQ